MWPTPPWPGCLTDDVIRRTRRGGVVASLTVLTLVLLAQPAAADVEVTPKAAGAARIETFTFTVTSGCDGSPTKQVAIRIPPDASTPVPTAPKGWTRTVEGTVITFTGPAQDPTKPLQLTIQLTLPDKPGSNTFFPTVQTCEKGTIQWTTPTVEGKEPPAHPAPQVLLTAGTPSNQELTSGEEDSNDDGSSPLLGIGVIAIAIAFLAGGGWYLLKRGEKA